VVGSSHIQKRTLRDVAPKAGYRSDRDDIVSDFLLPCLSVAKQYDRAVGYFTSSALRFILRGLTSFLENDGFVRLIASPSLKPEDVEAISKGYLSRETVVQQSLERIVSELESKRDEPTTELLTWLIARQRFAIKIAVSAQEPGGIYHEKIGLLWDSDDVIAFTGSLNETAAAFSSNFESIDVYCSWSERERVSTKVSDFERLWNNRTAGVEVLAFPEALKQRLIRIAPTTQPTNLLRMTAEQRLKLRDYQEEAIEKWLEMGRRGILEMATGTGKTITAIGCLQRCINDVRTVVLVAPLKHLVEQWASEIEGKLQIRPVKCFSDYDWQAELSIAASKARLNPMAPPVFATATYATASTAAFRDIIAKSPYERCLIADEMHNITRDISDALLTELFQFRLGLSATPRRHFDESTSTGVFEYFGGVIFNFGLADAIAREVVVPYDYFPTFCFLTPVEEVAYKALLREYTDTMHVAGAGRSNRLILGLLRRRESLFEQSSDKLAKFEEMIRGGGFADIGYNLVYAHHEYLDLVQHFLGMELHIPSHKFTASESLAERRRILDDFVDGKLKFITAIRCLDEGVDVPGIRTAFMLNSSTDPGEFVQRRGRVLRRFPGKDHATIYDYIVLPKRVSDEDRPLIARELTRFAEFANIARNRHTAVLDLEKVAKDIDLTLLDLSLSQV